jgi:hypothetical protein
MLALGLRPDYLIIVDESPVNLANTCALFQSPSEPFPFWDGVWELADYQPDCLVSLGLIHSIPFYCVTDLNSPILKSVQRWRSVDLIINTNLEIFGGTFIHQPTYGVLSIHPARLPYFRGDSAAMANLYLDEPLMASAFFHANNIDEGAIVDVEPLPVRKGDDYQAVMRSFGAVSAKLAARVLRSLATGEARVDRQQPWEGITIVGSDVPSLGQHSFDPLRTDLGRRLAEGAYSHYESN